MTARLDRPAAECWGNGGRDFRRARPPCKCATLEPDVRSLLPFFCCSPAGRTQSAGRSEALTLADALSRSRSAVEWFRSRGIISRSRQLHSLPRTLAPPLRSQSEFLAAPP